MIGRRDRGGQGERGQVIVEQAIILPMMVFLVLGIVQLTMIQQARIATEYAAYNAARAGIVYNGDKDMMTRAAFISLIPTMGRSDTWSAWFQTALIASIKQAASSVIDGLDLPGLSGVQMVDVEILEPSDASIFDSGGSHLDKKQLDFDDYRTNVAEANLLSVQVRYYYEMRIPFANWMIQSMWLAQRAEILENFVGINFANQEYGFGTGMGSISTGISADTMARIQGMTDDDQMVVNVSAAGFAGYYFFPIKTSQSMRMQSNLYRSNL